MRSLIAKMPDLLADVWATGLNGWIAVQEHAGEVGCPSPERLGPSDDRERIQNEIAAEFGTPAKVFVAQTRLPGAEGEVDWGQFDAVIGGVTVTLHLFSMWLAFSTRAFHRAYVNEAQESFTDAHVRAFERFDGVPHYDSSPRFATSSGSI